MNSISNPTLDPAQAALLQRYLEENPRAAERHGISTDPGGRPLIDHLPREVAVAAASATPRLAAPPPGGQPVDATALGNKLGQASTEVGADLFAVMALLHKMAQNSRKAAREMRAADNQERFTQLQAAADKVKEAAQKNYDAAVKQATAEMMAGFFAIAAAGVTLAGLGKAEMMGESQIADEEMETVTNAENTAMEAEETTGENANLDMDDSANPATERSAASTTDTEELAGEEAESGAGESVDNKQTPADAEQRRQLERAQDRLQAKWSAYGQIVGGLGQIVAGNIKMSAAEDTRAAGQAQAQEKTDEANAQKAQDAADKEKEFMQRMEETMQDIRQKLAAMQQSNDETMRTILRA